MKKVAEMDRAFEQALEAELREERLAKAILDAESHTPSSTPLIFLSLLHLAFYEGA